jgi:hypothetical protein
MEEYIAHEWKTTQGPPDNSDRWNHDTMLACEKRGMWLLAGLCRDELIRRGALK